MSNTDPFTEKGESGKSPAKAQAGNSQEAEKSGSAEAKSAKTNYADMQSAVRFPIRLPISVKSASGESLSETQNISANGVLFQMESAMPIGSTVDFTISLPADVVGSDTDVKLDCKGRVVRSANEDGRRGVGVVIDEYRFERR